jgi:ferric-dicitrate binding protein FerR (iron transport regulator)
MSTPDEPRGHRNGQDNDSERALRELFEHATPRPAPPAADAEEIRRAVFAEWDAVTGRRVLVRRVVGGALAAGVVAAVALLAVDMSSGPPPTLATVERVQGDVAIEGVADVRVGSEVAQDATVATHSGQVALRLAGGASLRLTARTELTLVADAEAELRSGGLYFDSGGGASASKFAVRTSLGTLRDVGTQFIAQMATGRLEIGVRDGRVALARGGESLAADAGERLIVPQGVGSVRRDQIQGYGEDWAWADRLAPPFDIDGRQLSDFLAWVAHETGRTLVFADPVAERVARETVLRGVVDLEPMQKLAAVMTTTDLTYTLDAERIVVAVR